MEENKTNINWFPGHMAKTMRQIRDKLNLVDAVIEVLDARCPKSSINNALKELIKDKPLLFVLNKSDMSDPLQNELWLKELNKETITVLVDSINGKGTIGTIEKALETLLETKIKKDKELGKLTYPIKVMVTGIPNSGKSTLMNSLAKRKALSTGDKPGVTKNQQYLKVSEKLLMLDNPGILWPKFENQNQAKLLSLIGSIKDEIVPINYVSFYGIELIKELYPTYLINRYKLSDLDKDSESILLEIGKKRGAIKKGGEIDFDKSCDIFIKDLRGGRLGRMTLERIDRPL